MTNIKRFLTLFLIATISAFSVQVWGADADPYEVSASSGALSGWSGSVGSAYADGSVKFNNAGTYLTNASIWSGEVSTGMTSIAVSISYKINGSGSSSNVFTVSAINSEGVVKASSTFAPTSTSQTSAPVSLTIPSSSNVTGLKIEYTTKNSGNVGVYSVSATASYTTGGGCTDPTTPLSITNANTATIGTPLSLTTGDGNGSEVTWSIVSGGSYASLTGSTLTPTAAGTVRVQASQGVSGGKCGATLTQDITISTAPVDVTLHYKGTTATLDDQPNPYTLPTTGAYVADACDEWKFAGWYGSTYGVPTASETKPTYITQMTSSGDAYAVYKHLEGGSSEQRTLQDGDESDSFTILTGVTGSFTKNTGSSSPAWYDPAVRAYAGNKLTITSTAGNITSINFTFASGDGSNTISASTGSYAAGSWSGSAESVVFTIGGSSGNRRFQKIEVSLGTTTYSTITDCRDCYEPTLTFGISEETKFVGDAPFTYTATPANNPMGGTITYEGDKPTKVSVNATTGEVTILDATANAEPVTITATLGVVDDGVHCQKRATASYTLNIYNRVTWSVNGAAYTEGTPTDRATEGGTITAYPTPDPDGSTMCGGKTFVGWTTGEYDSDTKPTPLYTSLSSMSSVHITDNTTFHAVFAEVGGESEDKYKKVTNPATEMTTGKRVLIVHHSGNKAYSCTESGDGYAGVSVTPDGSGKITTTNSNIIWTVEKGTTGYYFHQGDNYINAAEDKYGNHYLWLDEYPDEWTLTGSGPYVLASSQDPGYYIEYYSSIFKSYTGGSGDYFEMDFYVPDVGYTDYSTTCGPNIKAGEVERLTSTKDQTVKSQAITVKGGSLAGATVTATITGTDKDYFSCDIADDAVTAGVFNTTYVISYTPNDFGDAEHTATLTFSDGTTTSDPVTLRGRSLPQKFAIVAYDGAQYYALDGTMTGEAHTVKPFPVTVTAGAVDLCPTQAVYYLTERATPDENVHLVGPAGRLYGAGSNAGLNTKSLTSTSGTGWLLSTNNFSTYHITNATTTERGIMYNDANDVFGHYMTSNYSIAHYFGDIRLLPITNECTCLPVPMPAVVARATTATISWDAVPGAVSYVVTCDGGTPVVDGCRATITGLTKSTEYNFTVKAVASGYDCSRTYNGSFTTTNCDDVPYNITTTPGIKTVTVKWSMEAATAKICIYSDEECTSMVGSTHSGQTSPATITGLEENTQYYLKIFAGDGETCESSVIPFLTQTTTVEIAEWAIDHINIVLNADEATATVEIDNKKEHGSSTSMVATDIFFSKYFEASGFTKLVGLYNGTDHDIDISDLTIIGGKDSWTTTKGANNYIRISDVSKLVSDYGDGAGHIMLPKNTEIILYSIQASNKAGFTGEGCIDKFYDWDDLADNNVENWYRIGAYASDAVDGDGHKTLNFPGSTSIALKRGSKLIDIIGAGNVSSPTDAATTTIKTSHTLGNGRTINSPNDKPGWFVEDGWSPIPQPDDDYYEDYPEGYSTYLTTNRCLLIRANHVTSGDSAVLNNTSTFKTLGPYTDAESKSHKGEWVGIPIGDDGTSAERDCLSGAQFGYVGQYDYSDYYVRYDSIGELKELDGKRNDDGTYTIPIPQLDTMSCTMMKVKVYEGEVEKASREYKVPIMIDANVNTASDAYFHSYARETNSVDVCRECDVVILSTGTLTKASSEDAKDIAEIRNMTIYPGGTLIVPEGAKYEYTVNSIQFRVQGEQTPVAKLKGDLISNDQQVIVSRRIKNDRYYFFSLPYDCNIADIRWSNGEVPVRGTDYQIVEYDAETRAAEGSTKGAPGHWKPVSGSQLKAGVGYNIAVSSQYLKELVFPMAISSTNLTNKEDTKTSNKVTLTQHSGSSSINNHNWNLVAHPYVSAFNAYSDAKITAGWLECISPKTEEAEAVWQYTDDENVYLTMPSFNAGKITYEQELASGISSLAPFLAVFVQGKTEGELTFEQSGRKLTAPARHLAAKAEDEDESIFVGVTLSGNDLTDKTSVRIRPDFTNEYQLGYDLQKFTTYSTARPQIYMKPAELQLAFQAVSDSVAKNSWMPMGVYCYTAGTYTFGLYENYPIDEVEAVYLHDAITGTTTNLLYDTYTITTTKQLYTNTRFSLNVRLNRKAPQITTGIDGLEAPDGTIRKILINGHVYIQRGSAIYDVTGKEVFNF